MSDKSESTSDESTPKRFVIVGVGGIGSWLAPGICRLAEYRLPGSAVVLVDGDTFEPKNLERQNAVELEGNKAEVVANQLMSQFGQTFIIPLNAWVVSDDSDVEVEEGDAAAGTSKVRASDLLEDGDIVYAVVDNFKARADLVEAASKMDNVDVFLGGNDENLFGDVYHYRRREGQDITRNPKERSLDLQNPPDRNPGELSCQERAEIEGGTQLIATNLTVAALLLGRTQYTIIDGNEVNAAQIYFDLAPGKALPYDHRISTSSTEEKIPVSNTNS